MAEEKKKKAKQLKQREALDYLITLIGRAKKGLHVLRCPVFTENIGGQRKNGVRDEAPYYLRGSRLQPA